jgi:apolipoprotein N-acyltransferase
MADLNRYVTALCGGALLPLSLAPLSWWPVALVCCALLYAVICRSSRRCGVLTCLLFGIGLYATGASWIYVSIHQYGQASALGAALLTAFFVVGLGFIFALPLSLYILSPLRKGIFDPLVFAAVWVLGEWFRGWFLTGFPWLYVGYGFLDTWLAGWAPVVGIFGVSGIVVFAGALLGGLLVGADQIRTSCMALLLSGAIWLAGYHLRDIDWTQPAAAAPLRVALVQPDNPVLAKWAPSTLPEVLVEISSRTQELNSRDLIVWPESAIPTLQKNVRGFLAELDKLAQKQNSGLIMGIPTSADTGEYYNSVIGLGTAKGNYQKRRLVPFGEYVPLEAILRGAINFFDLPMSSFSAGQRQQPLIELGPYRIATAICYEIAYSDATVRDAQAAHFLLTVSNDTWFGNSLGPHQHLQIARARAVESGKALLRATNDGITAIIDEQGIVTDQLLRMSPGILLGEVMPRIGATPYGRWRALPVVLLSVGIVLLQFLLVRKTANRIERGKILDEN